MQVDLGESVSIDEVVMIGAHDDFNGIGDGFGFPTRYRVELSRHADFSGATAIVDRSSRDQPNPGVTPVRLPANATKGRYVRVTATMLSPRHNDFIFALAELQVMRNGDNLARGKDVSALDSIEQPSRWRKANLVDGIYVGRELEQAAELTRAKASRQQLLADKVAPEIRTDRHQAGENIARLQALRSELPPPLKVYAAATEFNRAGSFRPTHGKPRRIRVLARGDVRSPLDDVQPAGLRCVYAVPSDFPSDSP